MFVCEAAREFHFGKHQDLRDPLVIRPNNHLPASDTFFRLLVKNFPAVGTPGEHLSEHKGHRRLENPDDTILDKRGRTNLFPHSDLASFLAGM